jgi:hypothetical protein
MSYWYANERMDVSSEVFNFNNFMAQGYVLCFNEKCKMDGCLVHNCIRGKCMQHLYPSGASNVVDQMVHGDIAPYYTINGIKYYCVSTNQNWLANLRRHQSFSLLLSEVERFTF